MRNIKHTEKQPVDGLNSIGESLHKTKKVQRVSMPNPCYKANFVEKVNLENLFNEYNNHTNPCTLQTLATAYDDADTRQALYDMYDINKKFVKELREEITKEDNELILCPYCGKNLVKDMDHYIPRSVMPEFSIHCYNLIPLCHYCNNDKGDDWLEGKRRLFYNAYFDEPIEMTDIIVMTITTSVLTGNLTAHITMKTPDTAKDSDALFAAKRTVEKLHLIELYWKSMAKSELRELVVHIISSYNIYHRKHQDRSKEDFLLFEYDVLKMDIKNIPKAEFIKRLVYQTFMDSKECREWLLRNI